MPKNKKAFTHKNKDNKIEAFCDEYIKDLSPKHAAIRAGYSPTSAASLASRMLATPDIQKRIQHKLDQRSARTKINADTVLREIMHIAGSDIRKLFDERGNMLPPDKIPDEVARSISSIEINELFDGYGEDRQHIGYTKKVKFWDKVKALELIGKHLKLFVDKIEITADDELAERIARARQRLNEQKD